MGLLAILPWVLVSSCAPEGGPSVPGTEPSSGSPADSLPAISNESGAAVSPDTVVEGLVGAGVSGGSEEAVPEGPSSIRENAPDTAGFSDRQSRLEEENDSLRVAMAVLLSLLSDSPGDPGGGPPLTPGQLAPGDSSGLTADLLIVDTQQVQHWGLRIAVSLFFLALAGLFIRLVVWVLDKLAERNAKRRLLFKRMVPIARILLWFLVILFAGVVILRIEAQGLIAAGAAIGVAVGFAAQDILKNVFGGLIVLFDQPFQVGDKISVGGTYGEVVSIGLRSTRIVTPDDNLVSVPNAQVVDGQVANANAGELNCQVVTDLYLPGWVDEARAKRIAFEAAASSKYVFLNKPIVVLVKDEFKETFLTHLKVKAYVLDPRYEFLLMSDVTERARVGFREAGLLSPMHGVRAYVDLDGVRTGSPAPATGEEE